MNELLERVTTPKVSYLHLLTPITDVTQSQIVETQRAYKKYLAMNNKINSTISFDKDEYKVWRREQMIQNKQDFKINVLDIFEGNSDKAIKAMMTVLSESKSSILFDLFGEELCQTLINNLNVGEIELVVPCNEEECEFNYQGKKFKVATKELN